MRDFIAIDVETANWDVSSICQIGWSIVKDGRITQSDSILLDPETYFDPFNIELHGISEDSVRGAPTFSQVKDEFKLLINNLPVISYGLFDKAAFDLADDGSSETSFVEHVPWINGQKIIRRAWPEHFKQKYKLSFVAKTLGLELVAHDAGSDAQVLADAIILAAQKLDMTLEQLLERANQPLTPRAPIKRSGNADGPLSGENICFTGALAMLRRDAADLVSRLGASVAPSVTKKTTILIVGTQDSPLVVEDKSGKHRKAEKLISEGRDIDVLTEDQFLEILRRAGAY